MKLFGKSLFPSGADKPAQPPPPAPGKDTKPDPAKPEAAKPEVAPASATPQKPGSDKEREPAKTSAPPAQKDDKPVAKSTADEIPDVKTLKLERPAAKEEPPAAKPATAPTEPKNAPAQPESGTVGAAARQTAEPAALAKEPAKSEVPAKPDAPAAAKALLLPDSPAPAGLLAPPKKADEPTLVPATKPAEPAGPKPAQFQNLPAADAWCPAAIAEHYPELRAHVYEDCAATERVLAGGWRVVGATKRGRQHAHKATHREDAIAFNVGAQFTILAVSDGAGSCPLSRLGSHVASRTVTARLMDALPKLDKAVTDDADKLKAELTTQLTAALVAACQALQDIAAKTKTSAKDYRCTLLTLLHWRGEKHELLLANQIGDGAILVLNKDKSTRRIGEADSGQFSGEVSCFVPDDNARDKAKKVDSITPVEAVECVLLCTDGIEDPFFPIAKQAEALFRQLYVGVTEPLKDFKVQAVQPPILPQESAAGALGQWLEFEKRGENDDRSVLLLHRRPPTVTF